MSPAIRQTRALLIGYGLVILLILGILAVALLHIHESRRILDETVVEHNGCIDLSGKMYRISRERMDLLLRILSETDPFRMDEHIVRFRELASEFARARVALTDRGLEEKEAAILDRQGERVRYIVPLQEQVIDLLLADQREQAWNITTHKITPAHAQMLALLVDFTNLQTVELREAIEETRRNQNQAYILLLLTGAAALILALFIAVVTHRRMGALTGNLASTAETLKASLRELEFQKSALDTHAIVSVTDAKGEILYVNERFSEVSQYPRQELLGKTHRVVNSGYHSREFFAGFWSTILSCQVWHGELRNRRRDGSFYWMDTTVVPFFDEHRRPYQFVAVQTEITAAKEAEAVLARGKEELEALVAERTMDLEERQTLLGKITASAQDAIIMIDDTDTVTFWNDAAEAIFGYSAGDMLGRKLHDLLMPARYRGEYTAGFARFVVNGEGNFVGRRREVVALRSDGSEFPMELSLSSVKIRDRWTAIGIARDITERKQAEAALQQLATTDPLTGIANRRQLDTLLELEINRAERYHFPLSLIMFDIDHFKQINDRFGHQAGDRTLIDLTTLIAGNIRANDLFARWGGEEFSILANNCEAPLAQHLSEKLRELIEQFECHGVGRVTCSFGVTAFRPGESARDFVARADRALYLAKTGGRNRVETL